MINRLIITAVLFAFVFFAKAQQPVEPITAAEISLPGIYGDTIKLSSLKGNVVLVDFWTSWCGPCRVINRNMVDLYPKYKKFGFEILGVSIENDVTKWKNAIAVDRISWLQVNQPGTWNAPVAQAWGVERLPSSFLLDKEGNIIAIDPSYGVLESWLKELLIQKD